MRGDLSVLVQVLYEIAMSIGTSLNLERMLRTCLGTILRKLNCSAGAVLTLEYGSGGDLEFQPVFVIPKRLERNGAYQWARRSLPSPAELEEGSWPILEQEGNIFFHGLSLPGYGSLILVRYGSALGSNVLASLEPLLEKLANACLEISGKERAEARLRDSEGQLRSLLTQREKLIAELASKNEELERFVYTISHDLKSPLITIMGFVGMLEKAIREEDLDRLRSDIKRISGAADRMSILLNDLLELSRANQMDSPTESVSLGELARDVVALAHGRIFQRGVRIEIAPDLPRVQGNPTRLREVMQNLVENAVKFVGDQPDPKIEIDAVQLDGEVITRVRDNGIGLEPPYFEKVFDLFVQLNPGAGGTGVGLALVKRILEAHGGRVWVESEGAMRGCCFHFALPAAPSNHSSSSGGN